MGAIVRSPQKQVQSVRVKLVCNRAPLGVTDYLFTLEVSRAKDKEKRRGTAVAPRSVVRHFMLARVQIKDTKSARQDVKSTDMVSSLVQTMSSYVPNFILRGLQANSNPLVEPNVARFPACILFIDVSGMRIVAVLSLSLSRCDYGD